MVEKQSEKPEVDFLACFEDLKLKYGKSVHYDIIFDTQPLYLHCFDDQPTWTEHFGYTEIVTVNEQVVEFVPHNKYEIVLTEYGKEQQRKHREYYLDSILTALENYKEEWEEIAEIVDPTEEEWDDI